MFRFYIILGAVETQFISQFFVPVPCQYLGKGWPALTPWCAGHPSRWGVDPPQEIANGMQYQMEAMKKNIPSTCALLSYSSSHLSPSLSSCVAILFTLAYTHKCTHARAYTHTSKTSRLSAPVECLLSGPLLVAMFSDKEPAKKATLASVGFAG